MSEEKCDTVDRGPTAVCPVLATCVNFEHLEWSIGSSANWYVCFKQYLHIYLFERGEYKYSKTSLTRMFRDQGNGFELQGISTWRG